MTDTPRLPLIYSGRVRDALQMAEKAHRGVNRKSGDHPYLLHPVAVATVLAAADADDDLLCAAYLHDVVEDTEITLMAVEDRFGSRVARLVEGVTKPSNDGGVSGPLDKAQVMKLTEQRMAAAEADLAALKGADLVANMSDLIIDQSQDGYSHWRDVFGDRQRAQAKIEHYLRMADIIIGRLAVENVYPVLATHLRARSQQLRDLYDGWDG